MQRAPARSTFVALVALVAPAGCDLGALDVPPDEPIVVDWRDAALVDAGAPIDAFVPPHYPDAAFVDGAPLSWDEFRAQMPEVYCAQLFGCCADRHGTHASEEACRDTWMNQLFLAEGYFDRSIEMRRTEWNDRVGGDCLATLASSCEAFEDYVGTDRVEETFPCSEAFLPRVSDGDHCSSPFDCVDSRCDDWEARPWGDEASCVTNPDRLPGGPCESDADCELGVAYCNVHFFTPICMGVRPVGADCTESRECASSTCASGICADAPPPLPRPCAVPDAGT